MENPNKKYDCSKKVVENEKFLFAFHSFFCSSWNNLLILLTLECTECFVITYSVWGINFYSSRMLFRWSRKRGFVPFFTFFSSTYGRGVIRGLWDQGDECFFRKRIFKKLFRSPLPLINPKKLRNWPTTTDTTFSWGLVETEKIKINLSATLLCSKRLTAKSLAEFNLILCFFSTKSCTYAIFACVTVEHLYCSSPGFMARRDCFLRFPHQNDEFWLHETEPLLACNLNLFSI